MQISIQNQGRFRPFQECKFTMGQWLSTQSSYRLSTDPRFAHPSRLDLTNFKQSGQWNLIEPVNYFFVNRTFKNLTGLFFLIIVRFCFKFFLNFLCQLWFVREPSFCVLSDSRSILIRKPQKMPVAAFLSLYFNINACESINNRLS